MNRKSAIAIFVLIALLLGAGFIWDATGFGQNMVSELAGSLISIVVALLIVDKMLQRDRRRRWRLVRDALKQELSGLVEDFSYETYGYFVTLPFGLFSMHGDGQDINPFGNPEDFADLIESKLNGHGGIVESSTAPTYIIDSGLEHTSISIPSSGDDVVIRVPNAHVARRMEDERNRAYVDLTSGKGLLDVLEPIRRRISAETTLRLLQTEDDPPLLEKILEVERAWRSWRGAVVLVNDDWGFPEADAWRGFSELARTLGNLHRLLMEDDHPDSEKL